MTEVPWLAETDVNTVSVVEADDLSGEQYYRYSDGIDYIYLEKIPVTRHTNKGVWLNYFGENKFVLSDPSGRRFAYADKANALNSFRRRKEWQIKHARNSIQKAEFFLSLLERINNGS